MSLVFTGALDGAGLVAGREIAHTFFQCREAARERMDALVEMGGELKANDTVEDPIGGFRFRTKFNGIKPVIAGKEVGIEHMSLTANTNFIGSLSSTFLSTAFIVGAHYETSINKDDKNELPYEFIAWSHIESDLSQTIPKYSAGAGVTPEALDFFRYGVGQLRWMDKAPCVTKRATVQGGNFYYGFLSAIGHVLHGANFADSTSSYNHLFSSSDYASTVYNNITVLSTETRPSVFSHNWGQSSRDMTMVSRDGGDGSPTSWGSYIQHASTGDYFEYIESPVFKDNLGATVAGEIKGDYRGTFYLTKTATSAINEDYTHERVITNFTFLDTLQYLNLSTGAEQNTTSGSAVLTVQQSSRMKVDYSNCFPSRSSIT